MSFMKDFDHLKIQMKDVISATNNFDSTKLIGCGGFGKVYTGELSSPDGQITVAFKQLDRRLGQGNIEFWKEVMMLSKYKHENLISLLHFCIEGDEMILVYEYASRGSLDGYLTDASTLTWIRRLKICVGAARGLHFLHDPKETQQRVLHRDIKSSNILLDENWTAKVSDFGLSKVGPANQGNSYLFSQGVGTPGYCDPLYMELGFLSKESDVYSFGVVLLEILCGRLCYEYHNRELTKILVPKWRRCYNEKRLDDIILPGLKEQMHPGSLKSFSAIAYQCVMRDREERPTMGEVVEELEFSLEQQENYENLGKGVDYSQPAPISYANDSYASEDGPGIDCLQITGNAKPGGKLLAVGYPVRGTALCMFQWVRHFEDGTWKYIEGMSQMVFFAFTKCEVELQNFLYDTGATDAEYVVSADDVDKLISVECIPMDEKGQQGEVVRLFANNQNKITCDPEMQLEIDNYMSAGQATFSVFLMGSNENWEQTTFTLTQSKYQLKINHTQDLFMDKKYTRDLAIQFSSALGTECVLTPRPNEPSHIFMFRDVRTRDTFVLTMRMFQSKVTCSPNRNTPEAPLGKVRSIQPNHSTWARAWDVVGNEGQAGQKQSVGVLEHHPHHPVPGSVVSPEETPSAPSVWPIAPSEGEDMVIDLSLRL